MRNNSRNNWEFSNDGISLLGKFHFIVMGTSHSCTTILKKLRDWEGLGKSKVDKKDSPYPESLVIWLLCGKREGHLRLSFCLVQYKDLSPAGNPK